MQPFGSGRALTPVNCHGVHEMKSSAIDAAAGPPPESRVPEDADHEHKLLQATARGDRRAFERLYLSYHARLAGFIWHKCGRRDLVDEIINEAFWVVWKRARDFRGEARVSTWIIGITYRCMLKALRTGKKHDVPQEPVDRIDTRHLQSAQGDENERRELHEWVQSGLRLLPPEQRMAIELAYFHGRTCDEIATIMDCAAGTVKARLFHARARLRNSLPNLGGEPDEKHDDE